MINLLANTKGMRKEYQQAIAQQVALNKELTRGTSQATSQAGSFTTLENAVGKLDNHLKELVSQQAALNKEVSLSKQNTNAARDGLDRYENALEQLQREMRDVIASQSSLSRSLRNTDASAGAASRNIKQLEVQSRSLGAAVRPLGGYITGAFGILAAQNAAIGIKDTLAEYQQFSTRLRFLSEDTADYGRSMAFLTQLADEHGKSVLTLGESYTSLAALRKGDIINQQQQYDLMTGLSNAQSALGVSTDQLGNLMYGLGQALSQPTVQTAEFNQVMEPIPGLMQAITKAAGLQGKTYRDLVLEGEVTSAMFRDDLIKALGEYDGAAKANIDNITAQENALENLRVQTIAAFEQPISDAYGTLLETTGEALTFVRDNAETLTTAVETLTAVALVRGAAAVSNYSIALGRKAVAQQTATAATLAAAKKQHEHNLSLQLAAKRSLEVAANDTLRAGALTRLAAANQAVTASQTALNVATAQYSIVGRAATTVARGLWAAIGGIPGVVLLGAYAIYEWATNTEDATEKATELKEVSFQLATEINKLVAEYKSLNKAGKELRLDEITQKEYRARERLVSLTQQLRDEEEKTAKLRRKRANPLVGELREEIEQVEELLNSLSQKRSALFEAGLPTDGWQMPTLEPTISAEVQGLLDKLEQQRALYGEVGEAARIAYETTRGSLKNLSEAEKAALLQSAKKLDAHKKEIDARVAQRDAVKSLEQEVASLITKNNEEIALYGDTSREAKIRYDIEHGALKDINDALKQKLILQAKELDNLSEAKSLQSRVESIAVGVMTPEQRENNNYKNNINDLETYRDSLPESDLAKRQEINQLIEAEQRRHADAITQIQQGAKSQFDLMWAESFDRFASGVGQATASALFDSENLGDGLRNVTLAIGKQVVATLVEIGIKEAANWALRMTMRKADLADDAATTAASSGIAIATGTTTAAALTAAWTPAAAMVSLATMGANAAAATAGILTTLATAKTAGFAGFFDNGGHIPSGKFGIAGEYGPEFVKGPATVTSRVDTANILNRQAANDGGGRSVVFNDNRTINVSGGSTEEVMTQLAPILERQQQETLAKVGQQFKTGTGPVYSGYRASR
jgi:tape measure domain-containing protein